MEWHFDKSIVKIMRYIRRHKGVTEEELVRRFGEDGTSQLLINFSISGYTIAQNEGGKYFVYKEDKLPWESRPETRWYLTAKGNVVVETENQRRIYWIVPLIISILALAISAITLALAFYPICVKVLELP